ncbi:Fc.00g024360.m01.CDS01 [Cosmosporella sp. VM-42]
MPKTEAGDTVWWHTDSCHAVGPEHSGTDNASDAFIAACPATPANKDHVRKQIAATLEGRLTPDYAEGNNFDETKVKGDVALDGTSWEAKKKHSDSTSKM